MYPVKDSKKSRKEKCIQRSILHGLTNVFHNFMLLFFNRFEVSNAILRKITPLNGGEQSNIRFHFSVRHFSATR